MKPLPDVAYFPTSNGVDIYRIPMWVFPGYVGYAHLLVYEGRQTLVDAGSGFDASNEGLEAGFDVVASQFDPDVSLSSLDNILLTHGHIDHFGGMGFVTGHANQAKIGLHPLTRPVLVHYRQRVMQTLAELRQFLIQAGVPEDRRQTLLEMYLLGKDGIDPLPVDFTLEDGDLLDGVARIVHVPGHAPGLIMLQVGDVLLTSDHVLPQTSVVLAPESITPYTGVGHYLESLDRSLAVDGVRLALGGHEEPFDNYYDVVRNTRHNHVMKVENVCRLCTEPRTIFELACSIYEQMDGYGQLLKLEQVGARVEYLLQRGLLLIENVEALDRDKTPIRYQQARLGECEAGR